MKSIKDINYKIILIIPVILIAQYYLFKFGVITPMVKGVEIEIKDGDYIKDIDKFVMKLNDTVTLSTGKYIILPSYAKTPDIYFKNLDDSNIVNINENEVTANKEGTAVIGIMKNSRILKKINIKVVNPKVESLIATLDNDIKYVGQSARINSEVEVDYDEFKEKEPVIYESSDENILKIKGNTVEAVGVGKASLYIKAGTKETVFDYNIQAKIAKINIPSTIKIYEKETKKLNPKITTSPRGLKHGKIKYELVDRKVPIDYAISLEKDGTIVGLKEGTEKVRITCGNKQKIITIKVEKESIIDRIIENIQVNYEIINEKLSIDISWDYIKDINNYEIFLKNNSLGDLDYKLFDYIKVDESKISDNRVSTKIEVDLFEDNIPNLSLYVVGKDNNNISTKPSNVVNILPNLDNIEDETIENLVEEIDNENNMLTLTWDRLDIKDITYSIYVKDNNVENGFVLYENNIQDNSIDIPLKEEYDMDIYVVGSKYGKFSKQSNIINVKKYN
ncbi:hypothetical protein [Romboutsia sp. 13368]|uniref:hypothetical protein n=1 Tax=Romboutsia sp. 13368 TaxID=2708053 RepID=UPI0025D3EF55|nr:hypothetical protein [Romboutsia sp. 13368]